MFSKVIKQTCVASYCYINVFICFTAENRVVLRRANIVKHVVMFLAEQRYQDLHVFAVILLLSCVEDADIVKVIVFII